MNDRSVRTGELLRHWRRLRGMTQLELAFASGTSSRNLSFVETGRAIPKEQLIRRLCGVLDLSPEETHMVLLSAGHWREPDTTDSPAPELDAIEGLLDSVLELFEPYPVLVTDRRLDPLKSNVALERLIAYLLDGAGSRAESSWVDLIFHPDGLRPYLTNWEEVAYRLLHGVYRDLVMADSQGEMSALYERLLAMEGVPEGWRTPGVGRTSPRIRLEFVKRGMRIGLDWLAFTVGTPSDVPSYHLRLHALLPADGATRKFLTMLALREERLPREAVGRASASRP